MDSFTWWAQARLIIKDYLFIFNRSRYDPVRQFPQFHRPHAGEAACCCGELPGHLVAGVAYFLLVVTWLFTSLVNMFLWCHSNINS